MSIRRSALLLSACISVLSTMPLAGDTFRGPFAGALPLAGAPDTDGGTASVSLAMEEIAAVELNGADRFIQGVALTIDIPEEVQYYGDSFAVYLYRDVSPHPREGTHTYRGERILFKPFSFRNHIEIHIPARERHTLIASPDIVLLRQPSGPESYPLFVTILPIMKGIPGSIARARFTVTALPLYADEGSLQLRAVVPDGVSPGLLTVRIDGKDVAYPMDEYLLPAGMHQITISSSAFQDVQLSFGIERGKTTELAIPLVPRQPEIIIEAPANATVFLDGAQIEQSNRAIPVSPGAHTVVFTLGDHQVSRRFEVEPGKHYRISLFLDISIQER